MDASSQRDSTTIAQINVTPLVDVMLVLLVIFMVTAPIIQQGVQVNLPQTKSGAIPGTEEFLVVTVAKNGKIYLNDNAMNPGELGQKLAAIRKLQADKQVYLRADQDVRYGIVMKTIAEIKQAGIERLGMVTRPPVRIRPRIMAERTPSPTISIRERSIPLLGVEERLPKWITVSFLLHALIIAGLFVTPLLPSRRDTAPPVYTVDLVGGEKIGKSNLGTELSLPPKQPPRSSEEKSPPPTPETKKEIKVAREEKVEKAKPVEKKIEIPEKSELKEKSVKEAIKRGRSRLKRPLKRPKTRARRKRRRLIACAKDCCSQRSARQIANGDRSKNIQRGKTQAPRRGKEEGAAALRPGRPRGPGVVKGMDFVIHQNRMLSTIKDNWAWVGQRSNLRVVLCISALKTTEKLADSRSCNRRVIPPTMNPCCAQ